MEELKITKERVLAAAEECSDAKRILEKIFPEVFKKNDDFKIGDIVKHKKKGLGIIVEIRGGARGTSEGVEYFTWVGGHACYSGEKRHAKEDHGYYEGSEDLELYYRPLANEEK